MSEHRYINIFDTTLRDGEQAPGATLNRAEKLEIAYQLARLGVDIIEAGFPVASPDDFDAVQAIAGEVKGPRIAGLARAIEEDIRVCWDAVKVADVPRIHTFISTSERFLAARDDDSKPFIWTTSIDAILEKVGRGEAVPETVPQCRQARLLE